MYTELIENTVDTINKRAANHRNLVILFSLLLLVSILSSIVAGRFALMINLLLLVPLCSVMFYRDSRIVDQWRSLLTEEWMQGRIAISAFSDAMKSLKHLPQSTIDEMLAKLPFVDSLLAEQGLSEHGKKMALMVSTIVFRTESLRNNLRMLVASVFSVSLVLSVVMLNWWFLFPLILVPIILFGGRWISLKRYDRLENQLRDITVEQKTDVSSALSNVAARDWWPLPEEKKLRLLAYLG